MVNPVASAGKYSKFVVSVVGAVTTGLTTYFPYDHWVPTVITAISAFVVYLVPNQSSTAPPPAAA